MIYMKPIRALYLEAYATKKLCFLHFFCPKKTQISSFFQRLSKELFYTSYITLTDKKSMRNIKKRFLPGNLIFFQQFYVFKRKLIFFPLQKF